MNTIKTTVLISMFTLSAGANAALESRLDGLAYYDPDANLTWLANANAAGTTMTWTDANTWAAGLTVAGVGGWRLPDTIDVGNDGATYTNLYQGVDYGYNITTHSEMSNMFYNVLGNLAKYDTAGDVQEGRGLINTGPFSNIQAYYYWSVTEYEPNTSDAWYFKMHNGNQSYINKDGGLYYAWAIQSGDVSTVPVPAAAWLFGSALLGLIGVGKRKL